QRRPHARNQRARPVSRLSRQSGEPTQQLRLGRRKSWRGAHSDRARHGLDRAARIAGMSARLREFENNGGKQSADAKIGGSEAVDAQPLKGRLISKELRYR